MKRKITAQERQRAQQAIEQIARQRGVAEAEVRREMTEMITQAMADPNPAVRLMWETCPCAGRVPTPEEMLIWVSERAADALEQEAYEERDTGSFSAQER